MKKIDFNQDWSYRYNGGEKTPVTLPHDAMLHSPRSASSPGANANGFFEGGVYTYEKEWFVPADWEDKTVMLEFGGIYRNAKVYLNDTIIAEQPYGYTTFAVCLDSGLLYGAQNRVKVVADNSKLPNSRWYSGGGIYRPAWLYVGDAARVEYNGVKITTLSVSPAVIRVEARATADVKIDILDGDTVVASAHGADVQIPLENANLWSAETPYLYICRVTVGEDAVEESFGIRDIHWSTRGLFINGQETLLKGACIHHDHGILGACGYADAEERRIRKLKEFGFNAIRMAHHPASKELLDACDKLGMYVMDEAFDMWYEHKNPYDYATDYEAWHQKDLLAMVDKDYNHPSVILYSIGNEVSEPREEKGLAEAQAMQDSLHEMDPTRPVTAGINLMILYLASKGQGVFNGSGEKSQDVKPADEEETSAPAGSLFFNQLMQRLGAKLNDWMLRFNLIDKVTTPILDTLDIAGYNYAASRYALDRKKHPGRITVGSETFPQDIEKNWKLVEKYPNLIGDFMWTGWDYLGEAAIGAWNYDGVTMDRVPYPWLLADVGAFDITGYPGAEAYYAKTVWNHTAEPYIGVRPCNHPGKTLAKTTWRGTNAIDSWAWSGCNGNKVDIEVYSNAYSACLYLNGKKLSRRKLKGKKAIFKTIYAPGELKAVTYDRSGRKTGCHSLRSTDGKLDIRILPEDTEATTGKLLYVDIVLADSNGIVESNADRDLQIYVENGTLLGFGSAQPCTEESYLTNKARTYYGRAQAVILPESAENVIISVTCEKGTAAYTVIPVKPQDIPTI